MTAQTTPLDPDPFKDSFIPSLHFSIKQAFFDISEEFEVVMKFVKHEKL